MGADYTAFAPSFQGALPFGNTSFRGGSPHLVRPVTDANIDQIQDVTVEVSGGPRTFFKYGDVIIQTAAQIPKITFEAVPNPDVVARVLRDLRIEEEQEKIEGRMR